MEHHILSAFCYLQFACVLSKVQAHILQITLILNKPINLNKQVSNSICIVTKLNAKPHNFSCDACQHFIKYIIEHHKHHNRQCVTAIFFSLNF